MGKPKLNLFSKRLFFITVNSKKCPENDVLFEIWQQWGEVFYRGDVKLDHLVTKPFLVDKSIHCFIIKPYSKSIELSSSYTMQLCIILFFAYPAVISRVLYRVTFSLVYGKKYYPESVVYISRTSAFIPITYDLLAI